MRRLVVGITGRAGSGKSRFCSFLKEKGWQIIEADRIGWDLLECDTVKQAILEAFGRGVFEADTISRTKLREVVFVSRDKLKTLNRIVHPLLLKELKRRIDGAKGGIIAVDAALIPQWGIGDWFYRVVLLRSNKWKEHLRTRGFPESVILGLDRTQKVIDDYEGPNVVVIENNGTLEDLKMKADEFAERINEVWFSHLH